MHRNAGLAAMLVAGMALAATPRHDAEPTEEERKTPPPPPLPEPTPANLPGETNRQFAARMKARTANAVGMSEANEPMKGEGQ